MTPAQRRIIAAQIPPRLRGLSLKPEEERYLDTPVPRPVINWEASVRNGEVIKAIGNYQRCGKGIWATSVSSVAVLTALMRDLMMDLDGTTGLYLGIDPYLESMRPNDGDRNLADKATEVDLLVLAYVGTEAMTDWTRATVRSLLINRWEAGLPTLVSARVDPTEYLDRSLAREVFISVEIM